MKRVIVKPVGDASVIAPDGRRVPKDGAIVDLDDRWWRKRLREGGLKVEPIKEEKPPRSSKKTTASTTEETDK